LFVFFCPTAEEPQQHSWRKRPPEEDTNEILRRQVARLKGQVSALQFDVEDMQTQLAREPRAGASSESARVAIEERIQRRGDEALRRRRAEEDANTESRAKKELNVKVEEAAEEEDADSEEAADEALRRRWAEEDANNPNLRICEEYNADMPPEHGFRAEFVHAANSKAEEVAKAEQAEADDEAERGWLERWVEEAGTKQEEAEAAEEEERKAREVDAAEEASRRRWFESWRWKGAAAAKKAVEACNARSLAKAAEVEAKRKAEEEAKAKRAAERWAEAKKRKAEEEAKAKRAAEQWAEANRRKAEEEAKAKRAAEQWAEANRRKAEEAAAKRMAEQLPDSVSAIERRTDGWEGEAAARQKYGGIYLPEDLRPPEEAAKEAERQQWFRRISQASTAHIGADRTRRPFTERLVPDDPTLVYTDKQQREWYLGGVHAVQQNQQANGFDVFIDCLGEWVA